MIRPPGGMDASFLVRAAAARPELAEAALANECIRAMIAESPGISSEAGMRLCPVVRAEFEHATVIGRAGEGIAIGLRKNWGAFLGFRPLRPDDPVHPRYVLFIMKESSPYNRRVLQRKAMKRRLPRHLRPCVNQAYRLTRREFLAILTGDAAVAIRRAFGLDPIGFWRAANGKLDLRLPSPAVQLTLFGAIDDVIAPRWS